MVTPGAFVPPPPPTYGGFGAVGTPAGPGTGLNTPQCHAGLEKMTSLSLNNGPVAASQGSTIAVYPVSMHFMDGQCFCQELGGHLASITDEIDFQALQTATRSSGVKSAVFIGAHEISEGQWMFTDGTPANFGLLESHGWCTQSKQGGEHEPLETCLIARLRL